MCIRRGAQSTQKRCVENVCVSTRDFGQVLWTHDQEILFHPSWIEGSLRCVHGRSVCSFGVRLSPWIFRQKKMYPEVYKKQQSCEKILNLRNIDVLKEVCEGKRENELNQVIAAGGWTHNCLIFPTETKLRERVAFRRGRQEENLRKSLLGAEYSRADENSSQECIKEDLIARDWDRAARREFLWERVQRLINHFVVIGITPQKSFREFCASAWAAPWGNMSDHHQTWMRVDLNEVGSVMLAWFPQLDNSFQARVNLDTYVKRRNCHSINLHLACKYPDQYGEDFKKVIMMMELIASSYFL